MQIKNYSLRYVDRVLAQNFDVEFSNQAINVITGANGAGKTTLLDFIADVGPKAAKGDKINVPKQAEIAYQLQHIHFFTTLSVAQTITMYRQLGDPAVETQNPTFQIIKAQILDKIWHVEMGKLSGGERQMVLTYGQCLLDRKLYIFDEPTSGVDVDNTKIILNMIASLVQERQKLVIMTSHNLEQLAELPVNLIALA
ncbi:ABC transporter ATP-binding protein [Leuconostoc rapi]|uniref:ATP-binding cassette domain-containing protein n=1 Tax=Leuconostoc rapi TaxID=1406906 RepID=UPI001956BCE8|nr:ABC transporter ATP-binding protein [Leuconostoc rapi]MBM7436480.1 ABC-2 type transport system ATP-binding protein [Leuconostoc rapi]